MRQLEHKHGTLPSWVRKRVESADGEQILAWGERVLTANSLEEVFEDQDPRSF